MWGVRKITIIVLYSEKIQLLHWQHTNVTRKQLFHMNSRHCRWQIWRAQTEVPARVCQGNLRSKNVQQEKPKINYLAIYKHWFDWQDKQQSTKKRKLTAVWVIQSWLWIVPKSWTAIDFQVFVMTEIQRRYKKDFLSLYSLNNWFIPNRSIEPHSYNMSVKHGNICHYVTDPLLF